MITGIISDDGEPIENLPVFLYQIQNNISKIIDIQVTNKQGIYVFSNVLPGRYEIKSKLESGTEIKHEYEINE